MRVNVNRQQLERKLRQALLASPAAREAGAREITRRVVTEVNETTHRDTNRYVRGWALAANSAGCGPIAVRQLNKSSVWEKILAKVQQDFDFWNFVVDRYERSRRVDKWKYKAVLELQKARDKLNQLLGTEGKAVIAFNLYGGKRAPSFRHRIYGGTGRVVRHGDRTYFELHNLEPHTTLVEWKFGILKAAQKRYRGLGFRRERVAYLQVVRAKFYKAA